MSHIVFALSLAAFVLATYAFAENGWEAARYRYKTTTAFSYTMAFAMACLSAFVLNLWIGG